MLQNHIDQKQKKVTIADNQLMDRLIFSQIKSKQLVRATP